MHLNERSSDALNNLRNYSPCPDLYQTAKRSAVLVALLANSEGDLEVILTVRSSYLRTNAGDSAFPGGKQDPDDIDLIATAKREAFEEVRLEPSESQLLTLLPPVLSRHMQVVTPVVVYCPNLTTSDVLTQLYPNPGEVAAIFTSPLEYFLSPRPQDYHWFDMNWTISDHRIHRFERCGANNYILGESESEKHIEERNYSSSEGISSSSLADRSDVGWPVYGLTAGVLVEVAKIAYRREPDFEMFAPAQIQDESEMAKWYNSKYGTLRSPL